MPGVQRKLPCWEAEFPVVQKKTSLLENCQVVKVKMANLPGVRENFSAGRQNCQVLRENSPVGR